MTRTTNARIAGFTYLFYAAIGICIELLMHQARGGYGGAAMVARIGQYATNVRLAILITLLECLSSLVLAVTLYGIARDEDHELAMLGLVCRVAEGVLGSLNNIPSHLDCCGWQRREAGPVRRTSQQRTRCVRFCSCRARASPSVPSSLPSGV